MKKVIIITIIFLFTSFTITAQGVYLDITTLPGVGKPWTLLDGNNVVDTIDFTENELTLEFGLKIGYGPIASLPLYAVADLGYMLSSYEDKPDIDILFNHYLIGAGIIFYPMSFIQLGASIGYASISTNNSSNVPDVPIIELKGGLAWNISAAFEFGYSKVGILMGLKYTNIIGTQDNSLQQERVSSSMLVFFMRFTYRHKASYQH